MHHHFGNIAQRVQSDERRKRGRSLVRLMILFIVLAVTLPLPVFAQFGGAIKDITAKFEEPMPGGPAVNDIDGVVPKFAAGKDNKSRTALTRWEVTRGGPIFSAWTLDGGIQSLHFDFKGKVPEDFVLKLLDKLTVKDGNSKTSPRIKWPTRPEPKLVLPFPPPPFPWHQESVEITTIDVKPPEYAKGMATEWFEDFTGDPYALQRADAEGRITVNVVREVKTWRRSIRVSLGQKYVAAYDAYDWQLFDLNKKTPKLLRTISQVDSLMVMTPELYLASNVRVAADMREGPENRYAYYQPPFESLRKVGLKRAQIDAYYAENLRAAIDYPAVPWEWIDLKHPKAHELQEIVDSDVKNVSLTSKARRVEALARRGGISKLATNLISELDNKRSQAEALAGLETAAKLLKREPAEKLEYDIKGWKKWYEETKSNLASGVAPDAKKEEPATKKPVPEKTTKAKK